MRKRSSSSVKVFYPRLSREDVVRLLRERLPGLARELPLVKAVLFGSYARGDYTVGSDIDLLVVYSGPPRDDAYVLVRKELAIPGLEPHVYSQREYRQMGEVGRRMEAGGIVVYEGKEEG
ncbi:nucleotidyltransferase domain-containing protein [Candidatus Bipolaricaulota bacterium]|nr:nucleotidyltransferase domain-containing protein [Candidatus Bipolaricaulota bacterium]